MVATVTATHAQLTEQRDIVSESFAARARILLSDVAELVGRVWLLAEMLRESLTDT